MLTRLVDPVQAEIAEQGNPPPWPARAAEAKRSQIAIVDEAGVPQRNRNVPNAPAKLVPVLGALPPGTPVAFEAAYGWGWLVELLEELQLEPHLVHPSRCKAIASARLKNDKVDAATLAHLLRADLPPEAWIAPRPPAICGPCCATVARLERESMRWPSPTHGSRLMALPGVGRLTAMTLVAEIGDIDRFPSARKLCAWAGLTPQVRNSDRKVRHGHITKQGSPWVRGILQEAAQTAKRHPMFAGAYAQLARREAATSPPPPSLGGCWPAPSTS